MIVLKIDSWCYLLKSDVGLQTILKALKDAVRVDDHLYRGELVLHEQIRVEVSTVPAKTRFAAAGDIDPYADPPDAPRASRRISGRGQLLFLGNNGSERR